jgi:hypothetical protein
VKVDENNRWLRIAELIPWEELEDEYRKHFSDVGRPAKDAQIIIGLLLLKHMTGQSEEGLVVEELENSYMQAFCGFQSFITEDVLDSSTLTKMREWLGLAFFKELERKTYKVLIDRKIIKAKTRPNSPLIMSPRIKSGLGSCRRIWPPIKNTELRIIGTDSARSGSGHHSSRGAGKPRMAQSETPGSRTNRENGTGRRPYRSWERT